MKKPTQFFTNLNADRDINQKKSRHVIFMCDNSFDHKIFIMNLLESMLSFFFWKSQKIEIDQNYIIPSILLPFWTSP